MWKVKYFDELTTTELYEILRARAQIFVVEQNCVYQDLDQKDYQSLHVFYETEEGKILAYLRIFEKGKGIFQIGRVLSLEHGKGFGKEVLKRGIQAAKDILHAEEIFIEAQCYAMEFYEKEGFKVCSEEFLEDGIPHIQMRLPFPGRIADRLFAEYASGYDRSDGKINLKIVHTAEVAKVMDYITSARGMSCEMQELAHVCAMFHDIGRFEQIVRYGTFLDHLSVDHAELGCDVLTENKLLDFLNEKQKKQVLTAISNHNKLRIEEGLDEETLTLCKLIRDADKCDIFRVFACEDLVDTMDSTLEEVERDTVTEAVYDCFMRHECIDKRIRKTGLDKWVSFLAFFFDIYYEESIVYLSDKKYYRYQFDRADFKNPETREKVEKILAELEEYLKSRR